MFTSSRWRLRTFLYLVTITTIIPAGGLVFWSAYNQFLQAEEAAARQAYHLAQLAADNTSLFISDAEQLLGKIADRIKTRQATVSGCDPIFSEFKGLYPQFANLSQSSPEGYIVCSATPQPQNRSTFVGETNWFKAVYGTKNFVVGQPYKGPVTGRIVSVLAYPIIDESGTMSGAIQLPIDLVNFRLMPGAGKLPDSIVVSIFDSSGTLIARSREPEKFVGRNLRGTEAVEILLSRKDGTARGRTSQNVERIFGFRPVPGTDWLVIAGIASDVVLGPARDAAFHHLLVGAAGLFAVFLLALYVSNRIAKPISGMHETASRISDGEHNLRATVEGPHEVAAVASQFNRMLDVIDRNAAEQRVREAEIEHFAFYDALTGLPNRRFLLQKVEEALRQANEHSGVAALFYIDLDHFKNVNDAKGHKAGDEFLKTIAGRLGALRRRGDVLARIGGDEFVYIATDLGSDRRDARACAMEIGLGFKSAIELPVDLDGRTCISSASIGITLFPSSEADTSETLLHEADIAMYQVKQKGRNGIAVFEDAMRVALTERLAMEVDLRRAIEDQALELHIQTQVDRSGFINGAELLLRWNDQVRGFVSPGVFIPLAEQSDLILKLGRWVLRQGCMIQTSIARAGMGVSVSINVSPRQFHHPRFVSEVCEVLTDVGADPLQLVFEVTEGLLIEDLEGTVSRMKELAEMGIRFSIDDFGTGYSSLAYLKRLPLYEVKIDRSFISDIPGDSNDSAIVQSILGVASHLGLHVVAEGVETPVQAEFLRNSGCSAMQGYLFGRPMPVEEWIRTTRTTALFRSENGTQPR